MKMTTFEMELSDYRSKHHKQYMERFQKEEEDKLKRLSQLLKLKNDMIKMSICIGIEQELYDNMMDSIIQLYKTNAAPGESKEDETTCLETFSNINNNSLHELSSRLTKVLNSLKDVMEDPILSKIDWSQTEVKDLTMKVYDFINMNPEIVIDMHTPADKAMCELIHSNMQALMKNCGILEEKDNLEIEITMDCSFDEDLAKSLYQRELLGLSSSGIHDESLNNLEGNIQDEEEGEATKKAAPRKHNTNKKKKSQQNDTTVRQKRNSKKSD